MISVDIAFRIQQAAADLDMLCSLMLVMIDRLERLADHVDPHQAAKVGADLARIAFDTLSQITARLGEG